MMLMANFFDYLNVVNLILASQSFIMGNKLDESVTTLINQADFKTCTLKCTLYPKCKSISYKDDGTMCLIHQESLDDERIELVNAVGWTHARSEGYLYNVSTSMAIFWSFLIFEFLV